MHIHGGGWVLCDFRDEQWSSLGCFLGGRWWCSSGCGELVRQCDRGVLCRVCCGGGCSWCYPLCCVCGGCVYFAL